MEKEAFFRSLSCLQQDFVIVQIATDCHVQIRSLLTKIFPSIDHQFDVWHLTKSVLKKLIAKGKTKGNEDIFLLIKSITNHLWWCSQSCGGNEKLLIEKWTSLVHHIANVHSWGNIDLFAQCCHDELLPTDKAEVKWLKPGSPPHEAIQKIVLDKRLLNDVKKITKFCHTGSLEAYHSLLTKYCPKRIHFRYNGMVARTQLAILDHNNNVGRPQTVDDDGEGRYKIVFPKATKCWIAKPIYESKSYLYRRELLSAVIALVEKKKRNWILTK